MTKQFPKLDTSRGAPMGRREYGNPPSGYSPCLKLFQVNLVDGYDDGGAYWGAGAPLWCCEDDNGEYRAFVRATTRLRAVMELGIRREQLISKTGVPMNTLKRSDVAMLTPKDDVTHATSVVVPFVFSGKLRDIVVALDMVENFCSEVADRVHGVESFDYYPQADGFTFHIEVQAEDFVEDLDRRREEIQCSARQWLEEHMAEISKLHIPYDVFNRDAKE